MEQEAPFIEENVGRSSSFKQGRSMVEMMFVNFKMRLSVKFSHV